MLADLDDTLVIGELSLDGSLRHTTGVLPMIGLAQEQGLTRLAPVVDAAEAALVEGITITPVESLTDLVRHLTDESPIAPYVDGAEAPADESPETGIDLQHIRGQEHVKWGLEATAAS